LQLDRPENGGASDPARNESDKTLKTDSVERRNEQSEIALSDATKVSKGDGGPCK